MTTKKKKKSVSKKSSKIKSFKQSKETTPFMSFVITKQTAYWVILFVLIFVLALWVLNIQLDTLRILESITPTV